MEPGMLTIYDYVVMAVTLAICAGIGIITGWTKKGKSGTVVDYLLANRKMSIIPVSFSIMATLMSGIAMSGGIGEMFVYGAQYQFLTLSSAAGKLVVAFFIVPVFHQIEYVSVYEYLERRYDRTLRLLFSFIYLIGNLFYLGVVLYIPAISLTTVTGIHYMLTSAVIGIICVFYCVAGGYKAVIWTDVLQTLLMFSCFVIIIGKGILMPGGLYKAFSDSYYGDRMHFDWTEDSKTRYSVWGLSAAGFLMAAKNYCTNQAGVQRILSVKSSGAAQKSIYLSTVMMLVFKLLLITSGFVIYSYFKDCDPLKDKSLGLKSADQLLVYAIGLMLKNAPGLAGIALSGIISGSLSTFSSYINAFAALTLEDYLKPHFPQITTSEKKNIFICKVLTAFFGIFSILISFLIPYLGGAVKAYSSVVSASAGPLLGVMLLGMFIPKSNSKVCKIAMGVSFAFVAWLAVGAQFNKIKARELPSSIELCASFNETNLYNSTAIEDDNSEDIFPLYKLSFMWFGPLGVVITLIIGILLTFVWGADEGPDPRLLSPLVAPKEPTKKGLEKKREISTISDGIHSTGVYTPKSEKDNESERL